MRIKYARKLTSFIMWLLYVQYNYSTGETDWTDTGLCGPLRSIRLNYQLMTKLEMIHILQAQACGCISAYPGLQHQKPKRDTSGASQSQLNQAMRQFEMRQFWNLAQINVHNYLSTLFCDFPFIGRSGKNRKSHVTISLFGSALHTWSAGAWYWGMWKLLASDTWKLVLTKKQVLRN